MMAKGSPKPVMTGKKGNVGGMMTAGRHGNHRAAMMAGVKNLVSPGKGTKKTPKLSTPFGADDKNVGSLQQMDMNMKKSTGMAKGSPKTKIYMGGTSGKKGIHMGTRPEPSVKRDMADVIKPNVV